MMLIEPTLLRLLLIASLALAPTLVAAQGDGELEIEAKPLPGQLDVLQSTAFQLGGTPSDRGPKPSSYKWEILEGKGGELINADRAEAIFRAPVLEDKSLEIFVIQLTAPYQGQEPATATLQPEKRARTKTPAPIRPMPRTLGRVTPSPRITPTRAGTRIAPPAIVGAPTLTSIPIA